MLRRREYLARQTFRLHASEI
eukprot:SAG11_NODE_33658_length_276_cov_0.581921_1_plen_20_part_01